MSCGGRLQNGVAEINRVSSHLWLTWRRYGLISAHFSRTANHSSSGPTVTPIPNQRRTAGPTNGRPGGTPWRVVWVWFPRGLLRRAVSRLAWMEINVVAASNRATPDVRCTSSQDRRGDYSSLGQRERGILRNRDQRFDLPQRRASAPSRRRRAVRPAWTRTTTFVPAACGLSRGVGPRSASGTPCPPSRQTATAIVPLNPQAVGQSDDGNRARLNDPAGEAPSRTGSPASVHKRRRSPML